MIINEEKGKDIELVRVIYEEGLNNINIVNIIGDVIIVKDIVV